MMDFNDAQHILAATRFLAWTTFLALAWCMWAYLWKVCRLRFWEGTHFNRATFGWAILSSFLAGHQAFWWAVEHHKVISNCDENDPIGWTPRSCEMITYLYSVAPYLTPWFYGGMIAGVVLIIPPIITELTGHEIRRARSFVELSAIALWMTGWMVSYV